MSKPARKSPETDKKGKAIEAYHRKQEEQLCPNPSTTPPESIRARPALRAPRLDPRTAPHQKQAAGKNANGTHT
jgi:hypothetical protein